MSFPTRLAATNCERTVAAAAPPTPSLKPRIKRKSRPMFNTTEQARKSNGTVELPMARSR